MANTACDKLDCLPSIHFSWKVSLFNSRVIYALGGSWNGRDKDEIVLGDI